MLNNINNAASLNMASHSLPVARVGCFMGAGYIVGKKLTYGLIGVAAQNGAKVAHMLDKDRLATYLGQQGTEYIKSFKENLSRDIAIVGALTLTGIACEYMQDAVNERIDDMKADGIQFESYFTIPNSVNLPQMMSDNTQYPLDKAKGAIQSAVRYVSNAQKYLAKDFRFTAPYEATKSMAKNFFGSCGPQCQRNKLLMVLSAV